jgi:hypothetical protein
METSGQLYVPATLPPEPVAQKIKVGHIVSVVVTEQGKNLIL